MTRRSTEIIASTSNIWMMPPKLYPTKPINQPMIKMTAITYSKLLIIFFVLNLFSENFGLVIKLPGYFLFFKVQQQFYPTRL